MQYIKAPDFPTGAYIYGLQGVKDAYLTGRGRIIIRAKAEIESDDSHDKIVVTEIPYGVNKAQLYEFGRIGISYVTLEEIASCGATNEDTEGIIDSIRDIDTVEVAALLRESEDGKIRVSLRGKSCADVSKIATQLGGR